MKESAVDHYTARRGNCAQAVALAWTDKKDPESTHAELFAAHGGGRAPEGLCGALHAARELAREHRDALTARFREHADGHTTCRDIRKHKTLSCAECVSLATGLLEEHT